MQFNNGQLYNNQSYNRQFYNSQSYNGIRSNNGNNGGLSSPPNFAYPNPNSTEGQDNGIKRQVPILASPPLGAGVLAIFFFFLIMFLANPLLTQVNLTTLGIVVTIASFVLMGLTVLILFLL